MPPTSPASVARMMWGVVEPADGLDLPAETRDGPGFAGSPGRERLDGDDSVQPLVDRLEDGACAAFTQPPHQPIRSQLLWQQGVGPGVLLGGGLPGEVPKAGQGRQASRLDGAGILLGLLLQFLEQGIDQVHKAEQASRASRALVQVSCQGLHRLFGQLAQGERRPRLGAGAGHRGGRCRGGIHGSPFSSRRLSGRVAQFVPEPAQDARPGDVHRVDAEPQECVLTFFMR